MTITAPKGFAAASIIAGIKQSGRPDLALVYSEVPAVAAAVFTGNQFKAAPILVSMRQIKSGYCQAIISNAGNANCGTGKQGLSDARTMVRETARILGINERHVLVTSTGSIGKFLPMKNIIPAIRPLALKLSTKGGHDVARAIMTTDTRPKEITVKVDGYTVAGVAKGAGMIHPNMATMHAFITTDAIVPRGQLQKMLAKAVDKSFNMMTVDQCQSTNDCVFALANGMSGVKVKSQKEKVKIYEALEQVCIHLAREIARDGEGATQLIEVRVSGARNDQEARIAARAIAGSDLLKCAIYGKDYNLGRIFAAVGSTAARLDQERMRADIKFGKKESLVTCDLGVGKATATAWGCDLTEGYVKINADYHT
ncbi:MAG: bifunctional glutamate N-acetyltransferase/amino-acid acetyltransferase ArgJ [Candidatus Margulisbacteria bacterium]|jgi:glutamate N-acetyltransferase/amino-acid N-acetyltransferase|nr:bifunctional glutamate N-acetyltransferase/amino-acid acetyltransferase ArgJ [Candidatus Margulisiibacteriota bacterium]